MGSLTNAGEELFLEHTLDINRIATAGVNVQVALSTANPTESGGGLAEPSLGYARQTVNTWNAASSRKSSNNTPGGISFGPAGTGGWGTITHWAVFWGDSPGILMFYGQFASGGRQVNEGDTATIPDGELEIAFTDSDTAKNISNYLANELLDHFLKVGDWNLPTANTVYIGAWAADLDNGSTGATAGEPGNGYARVARLNTTWSGSSQESPWQVTRNLTSIQFPQASGGGWGTISDLAVCDTSGIGTGNILYYGALATPRTINDQDTLTIAANDFTIRMQ